MIVDVSGVPKVLAFALNKSRLTHEERTLHIFYHIQLALPRYRSVAALRSRICPNMSSVHLRSTTGSWYLMATACLDHD